jgi:hypothetical protein
MVVQLLRVRGGGGTLPLVVVELQLRSDGNEPEKKINF